MGSSPGKCIFLCLCAALFLVCSCDKHHLGEYPQVQRELADVLKKPDAAESRLASPTPAAQPTPAQFFPTKP
jgi:hypothetical protein